MKKILSILLIVSVISLCGCEAETVNAENLMSGIEKQEVTVLDDIKEGNQFYREFAFKLFQKSFTASDKNTLISPLSVIYALGLTSNGANDKTLSQMEEVLGFSKDELNLYLHSYSFQKTEKNDSALSIANSIWFRNELPVYNAFLQENANFYGADAYKADFNDPKTISDINNWVNEKTKNTIPKVVDELDEDTMMLLINALAFEAEWAKKYSENEVRKGKFTSYSGVEQEVEFMYSDESDYLETTNATGFLKKYKSNYAFVALIPDEGASIEDLVSSLDGKKVSEILNNKKSCTVYASMPKFQTEYSCEMKDVLKSLGMTDAFKKEQADFSKLSSERLYISKIIHKTFISVAERGTKAGAVTAVVMDKNSASMDSKTVKLDRPFVYMIVDLETNTPIFIGTFMGK